jgi:hypothetical protein
MLPVPKFILFLLENLLSHAIIAGGITIGVGLLIFTIHVHVAILGKGREN